MILGDGKVQEVPVLFVKGELKSPLEAKWNARPFLAALNTADYNEYTEDAFEEVPRINVLADVLEGKANWDLVDLRRVPTLVVEPVSVTTMVLFVRRARWLLSSFLCQLQTYCRWQYGMWMQ